MGWQTFRRGSTTPRRADLLWIGDETVSYVWSDGGLVLDPDEAVVRAIRALLERFRVEPSVCALLRWAHEQHLKMPTRRTYADAPEHGAWDLRSEAHRAKGRHCSRTCSCR